MRTEERLLALNGVHALGGATPCQLAHVEPASALEDLHWSNALVVRARAEGRAELACGSDRLRLQIVKPARLELVLVDAHVKAGQPFHVRALPRDGSGRELEIGKWTELVWRGDAVIASDDDQSAAEFGLCPTCFGMHRFRAGRATTGVIEARFGDLAGSLRISVQP